VIQSLQLTPPPDLTPVLQERAFAISPGQIFTLNRLWTTQASLDRLDVFEQYQFELKPGQEQRFDLTFRSVGKAQPVSGWLGRVLPLVRGLPYQTLYFDRYNLGRRGVNFSSLWRWDAEKRRGNVDLSGPFRQNPQWRYRWILDARDENWDLRTTYRGVPGGLDGVNLQKVETGADLQFGLSGRLQWTTGLRVAARRFRHGDGSAVFANSWSFAQQNGLDYRLWIWPERRVHVDASVNLETGRLFAGSAPVFATIKGDLNGSWMPQSKGDNLAVNARIRSGWTFGAVPFDELFMLGMERDNDLWLRGHLGAHDGRKGSAPLGTEYALAQTEVLRTLWQFPFVRLQAGPFFDAGRITDRSGAFGSRGWLYDAGVQVTVATIGAVRWSVIYGRDLRDGRGVFYTSVSR
jgi:hypothetical protein